MTPITIPRDNANDDSVVVGEFLVANGTLVSTGDDIAEIETSKVNFTIESPAEGYIQFQCREGDDVEVGAMIATVHDSPTTKQPQTKDSVKTPSNGNNSNDPVFSNKARALFRDHTEDQNDPPLSGYVSSSDIVQQKSGNLPPTPPQPPQSSQKNNPASTTSWPATLSFIAADLFRYDGRIGIAATLNIFLRTPGFRISCLYRVGRFTRSHSFLKKTVHPFLSLVYRWQIRRFGLRIPFNTEIGPGLYIGHWGGTWINAGVTIGSNCNLGQNVSIGSAGPDAKKGHPTIGDNVFIGPGAAISGPIIIGDDVLISANAFVMNSAPDHSCLMGVPAKIVNNQGSGNYINHEADVSSPLLSGKASE